MFDTFQIFEELKQTFEPQQAEKLVNLFVRLYRDIANTVTKEDFRELTEIVKILSDRIDRLAEAHEKAEERLTRLEHVVGELTEAQKRTEESLESFKKTTEENFNRVWKAIDELAEAQKRTEERLNELAEAQKRTEEELMKLIGEHRKTREHLGNLSHTVGYVLEDRSYKGLPELLKRDFGIEVIEGLRRDYIEVGRDKYEEVNILGRARKNGKEIWIIGECKSQLKRADVDEFLKSLKRIEPFLKGEKLLIAVTYQISPPVRRYVEEKGIKLYFSYEMPL